MTIELNTIENFVITRKGDSSIYIGLTREEAGDLLSKLRVALGEKVGLMIPMNSPEPDLPVGTQLRDEDGDVLVRDAEGWRWLAIDGKYQIDNGYHTWRTVSSESIFVVIS